MCQSQVSTTPWKIKWNLKITCLKRNVIFQTVIFGLIDSDQQKLHLLDLAGGNSPDSSH